MDHIHVLKNRFGLLVVFLVVLVNVNQAHADESFTPKVLTVTFYEDGVVDVDYELDVDPTLAIVNITLCGENYENLIISDDGGLLLDHMDYLGYTVVDILGSPSVDIHYSTPDLTTKVGARWGLFYDFPIRVNLLLPLGATITALNPIPISISTINGKTSLTMPPGEMEVSYVLGLVGTKDQVPVLQKEAEELIAELKLDGIAAGEVESLLVQSTVAYANGRYSEAEQYASRAKSAAVDVREAFNKAETTLRSAQLAVDAALEDQRTSSLDDARLSLGEAYQAFIQGDYINALFFSEQASLIATTSTLLPTTQSFPSWTLAFPGALLIFIGYKGFRSWRTRFHEYKIPVPPKRGDIDLEALFEVHRFLRFDEKEVLRFIFEAGGGAFASEIRERFDLPKSSAWRMVRRLESEEIVETRTIGRETYVEISSKILNRAADDVEPAFQMVPTGSYYDGEGAEIPSELE